MSGKKQGFLVLKGNKIKVNHNKTDSVLLNKLQVDFLTYYRKYFNGKLLDAGCGEKPYKLLYGNLVSNEVGCDIEGCIHNQKEVDVFASIEKLPFDNETFDTILCTNVMEHIEYDGQAFRELARVLKKNGTLILSVPFLYPVHEAPYDFQRYSKYGLETRIQRNGLIIKQLHPWGGAGLLLLVYINLFFCKFIQWKWVKKISCILQEGIYFLYKRFFFKRILCGKCKLGETISLGYFSIIRKE